MPIEIRELVIRAIVEPRGRGASESGSDDSSASSGPAAEPPADTEQIVQACVREVMRILAAQRER